MGGSPIGLAERVRTAARIVLAVAMVTVGVLHFVAAPFFVNIVPAWLPWPHVLVWMSGVFEIALGVGVLPTRTRPIARIGLILLYVAVFPANVNMVIHPQLGGDVPLWALWARLPLQALFIAWAWWVGRPR
jgi:uncharacterized membrane protein